MNPYKLSEEYEKYFNNLSDDIDRSYAIGNAARAKGCDPELFVEALLAGDLAARVEGLVGPKGIADHIRKIGKENIVNIVDFILADEAIDEDKRTEQAIRTSLAILTEGIVAAPIEGISKVEKNKNPDGTSYISIYFAGPIRSAGGTAQGLAVLIANYISNKLGFEGYRPTGDEIERYIEEIHLYNDRVANLQYMPSDDEIRVIITNCPVCIDGDPTEDREVAVHRDLARIKTNAIRGGMCLVTSEGMAQKSKKLLKKADEIGIDWSWLSEVHKERERSLEFKLEPNRKYMEETIGGRPIFAGPSERGSFRLRYGRSRASGIAAKSMHPATMILLDGFIATGTQLKVERPGKGCTATPCSSIEGPLVRLKNGSFVRVEDVEYAKKIAPEVESILFLGDILVSYGDFLQTNHPLVPAGYCEEWWVQDVEKATGLKPDIDIPPDQSVAFSKKRGVPLHPKYTYRWEDLSSLADLERLIGWLGTGSIRDDGCFALQNDDEAKKVLEFIGCPHRVEDRTVLIDEYVPLLSQTGMECPNAGAVLDKLKSYEDKNDCFGFISSVSTVAIKRKSGTYIGARMGRPEKAAERKMQPPIHLLFPIGDAGGKERNVNTAAERNRINVEIARFECPSCRTISYYPRCSSCGSRTVLKKVCPRCTMVTDKEICPRCKINTKFYGKQDIPVRDLWMQAVSRIGVSSVKGVKGMISEYKIPEPIEKGILRAKNEVYVFKDGTIRYDATNAPLTHFKPVEINTPVEKLKDLGYKTDYKGSPLENENQILELRVQDVILPAKSAPYLLNTARFIDSLLSNYYGLDSFYKAGETCDLVGHLIIGLAPHTSVGITGRIIGFTTTQVCYAHPYWHAAKRRNCDGDADAVSLLMDVLLNFSKKFLPETRGGKMDAPLVITPILNPKEVDDEAHKLDIVEHYPMEFYESLIKYPKPSEVKVSTVSDLFSSDPYMNLYFTHDNGDINGPVQETTYVKLKDMIDKANAQLSLAEKTRAINEKTVAEIVINSHFLKDTYGNLRAFSRQTFRCSKCDTVYRRIPLSGKCTKCGGPIILTVSKGAIVKYLGLSKNIVEKYHLSEYMRQRLVLLTGEVDSLFTNDRSKQAGLADFM